MMHWYLKQRIRRAFDRSEALPLWIQRRVDSDRELSRFAKEYAQMMQRLKAGADAWIEERVAQLRPGWIEETSSMLQRMANTSRIVPGSSSQQSVGFAAPPRAGHSRWRWAFCGVALVLSMSVMYVSLNDSTQLRSQLASEQNAKKMLVATRAIWNEGHRVADRSRVVWERTIDSASRKLVGRISDSAVAPIAGSSRVVGAAMHELHKGAVREKDGLVEFSKHFGSRINVFKTEK